VHFSHPLRWAEGRNLFSRLSWADHLRNTRIAFELEKKEPLVLLDIGCGAMHPTGVAVSGMGLDTLYVGLDINLEFAERVCDDEYRRPAVGLWTYIRDSGVPMRDNSCDVITCLEAMEHFVVYEKGFTLDVFFCEIERLLQPWGILYLATPVPDRVMMHPHCHDQEFAEAAILDSLTRCGLACWQRFNYRARPQVAKKLRVLAKDVNTRGHGFPPAVVDAFELPKLTHNALVPGNALYMIGHATT
jgi:SAM-dependent methyltransferase